MYKIKTDYPVYSQKLVESENRDITYFPRQDVIFIGCFKGSLEEAFKRIDKEYSLDHPVNKEYKAIIQHFQNLESIRRGKNND